MKSVDSHIGSYSHINQTAHDNIDDTASEHVHTHKHSHDGKEHEHKHKHLSVAQHDFKALIHKDSICSVIIEYNSTEGFEEKNLISNPHLSKIFRPPIV